MTIHLRLRPWILGFVLLTGARIAVAQDAGPDAPAKTKQAAPKSDAPKKDFDKTGPQVGEQMPDLRLHTMKGEVQRLSDAWRGGPALLITSSLTCPKSRSRWPELKELVDKYDDQLNIVIVYVIEAHPVGSVCPYKGVEDITPENERDGILRKQPKSVEDRLELAQEFKRLLRINTPIYVDNMQDEAWKGLGAAPNLALLVDREGKVAARSGWFEGKKSQEAIDNYLQSKEKDRDSRSQPEENEESKRVYSQLERAGIKSYSLASLTRDSKTDDLARMLKAVPKAANLVIMAQQGHPYAATLLMDAVREKNVAAVKLLLVHGADVKARTESFDSALQIAAERGNLEIAKLLLAKGADPAFPAIGKSPLHEAALHGHTDVARLLLDTGLRHDLYSAIAAGEIELVREGLQADASRALRPDGADRMPMDYAAANGQLEIAKLLLANGAPVVRDKRSQLDTPLHRAIARKDVAMAELLLEAGSSPDTSVGRGGEYPRSFPALHAAVAQKDLAMVNLLLSYKVDLKARDTFSQTALHDAAAAGQAEIAAALIKAGADVNAPQLGYELPCGSGDERIPSNTTPLHFAAGSGNPATLKVLLAAGAKLNAVTRKGLTPLMHAAENRRWKADQESRLKNVECLIAAGAEVNAHDNRGRSVLDVATDAYHGDDARSQQDHQEMLALLQKHGAKPGMPKAKTPAKRDPFGE
jgi:ankyrin repeat protein